MVIQYTFADQPGTEFIAKRLYRLIITFGTFNFLKNTQSEKIAFT